jgi:hypothetical protein
MIFTQNDLQRIWHSLTGGEVNGPESPRLVEAFLNVINTVQNLDMTTLEAIKNDTAKLDIALSTRASEATQLSIFQSLGFVPGDVQGRTHHEVNIIEQTTSAILFTVPAGKNYRVLSVDISATNTSTSVAARMRLRDGAGGSGKFSLALEAQSGGTPKAGTVTQTFVEPLVFDTNVYFEIAAGTVNADVILSGYLEDE